MDMDKILFTKFKLFGLYLSSASIFVTIMCLVGLYIMGFSWRPITVHKQGPDFNFFLFEGNTAKINAPVRGHLQMRGSNPDDVMSFALVGVTFKPLGYVPVESPDPWGETSYFESQLYPVPDGGVTLVGDKRDIVYRLIGEQANSVEIIRSFPLRIRVMTYIIMGVISCAAIWFVYKEHMRLRKYHNNHHV